MEELEQLFADIDDSEGSAASKSNKKLAVLKQQVRVRKKVMNQKVPITFTHLRKKRPLPELIKEVKEFIAANPPNKYDGNEVETPLNMDPFSLVGRHVYHRFIDESTSTSTSGSEQWYEGFILGYNATTRLHEIAYVEEEENFHYNLIDDLVAGDLKFND